MKLFYKSLLSVIIFFLLITSTTVYSQRPYKSVSNISNTFNHKAVTDTLIPFSFLYGTLTLDTALAGGYVCGTNAYNDIAKAQIYYLEDSMSYYVNGCGLYVGDIQVNDSSKNLTLNLYDLSGMGYSADSLIHSGAPYNIIATIDIPVSSLSENQINYIYFPVEVWVYESYAMGIDFSDFGTNQIGLISTSNGDAQLRELAWEKLNNGQWYSMLTTWPFDGDMGIFSLINSVNANIISRTEEILGSISVFPNPSPDNTFYIKLQSLIESTANISVYNMDGSLIYKKEILLRTNENILSVNLPDAKTGSFFVSVKIGNKNYIKKIILL